MLLASFLYNAQCFTFNCEFSIEHSEKEEKDANKFPDRIACIAEIESYDGDDPKLASFNSTSLEKHDYNGDATM